MSEVARWALFAPPHRRPFVGYRLRWVQRTLGALVVLSSVGYLAASLAGLEPRRRADAAVDDLLRSGEVALMRRHDAALQTK